MLRKASMPAPISSNCFRQLIPIIILLFSMNACSEYDKANIHAILDARDQAVSTHNINAYNALLVPGYHDNLGQSELDIVSKMNKLFDQFEAIDMTSSNRIIRRIDAEHAQCEQSYLLRVKADGTWRQLNQRERIFLIKTMDGWKISGGL